MTVLWEEPNEKAKSQLLNSLAGKEGVVGEWQIG